jgi:polyketide cyclase/dehydrase/lipid transport protein
MVTLLTREFTVDAGLARAWEHLARIEQWPSWAPHIKRIELQPPGELGPQSTGVIHLAGGITSAFRMTEFNPPLKNSVGGLRNNSVGGLRNWKWAGPFLWITVHYDHWFDPLDDSHTRLTWTIAAEGLGASVLGPLFAALYRRSLERAIPLLIREMNANPASV